MQISGPQATPEGDDRYGKGSRGQTAVRFAPGDFRNHHYVIRIHHYLEHLRKRIQHLTQHLLDQRTPPPYTFEDEQPMDLKFDNTIPHLGPLSPLGIDLMSFLGNGAHDL